MNGIGKQVEYMKEYTNCEQLGVIYEGMKKKVRQANKRREDIYNQVLRLENLVNKMKDKIQG